MKKDSGLVLLLIVASVILLALASLYFGAPLFGWLIIACIFAIFIGTAVRDYRLLRSLEVEASILEECEKSENYNSLSVGFVAERFKAVNALGKSLQSLSSQVSLELLNARLSLHCGKSASGVVILLGLMGTFFGLMLSVSTAGSTIDNSSSVATMNSIQAIFSNMKGIFGTSLCGIFASLILAFIHSRVERRAEIFASDLDLWTISKLFPMFASEKEGTLSDEDKLWNQVGSAIEKTGTRLTESFEKSISLLENRFSSVIDSQAQKMQESIVTLTGNISNSLKEQANNASVEWNAMLKRFSDIADAGLTSQDAKLKALQESSESLSETLGKELQGVGVSLNETFITLSKNLDSQIKTLLESSISQWNEFMQKLSQKTEETENVQRESIRTLADVASQVAEKAQAGSLELSSTVSLQIEELSSKVQTSFASLAEASSSLVETQKRLIEEIENRVVRENEASSSLAEGISEAATLMRVNQSEFAAGLEMFNKGLEALFEKLSGETEEKEEEGFLDQIRRSLEIFHERASEILVENAVKTQEILLEILEQSQRAVHFSEKNEKKTEA